MYLIKVYYERRRVCTETGRWLAPSYWEEKVYSTFEEAQADKAEDPDFAEAYPDIVKFIAEVQND